MPQAGILNLIGFSFTSYSFFKCFYVTMSNQSWRFIITKFLYG